MSSIDVLRPTLATPKAAANGWRSGADFGGKPIPLEARAVEALAILRAGGHYHLTERTVSVAGKHHRAASWMLYRADGSTADGLGSAFLRVLEAAGLVRWTGDRYRATTTEELSEVTK